MSHIPSLTNPPNAPKKKKKPNRRQNQNRRLNLDEEDDVMEVSWKWLADRGVRPKFLRYNPDDVEEIDDIDTLLHIRELYLPPSQPQSLYEHSYCTLMVESVDSKLYTL